MLAASYAYDANGNREAKVEQSPALPAKTTTYTWDEENRLTQVSKDGRAHQYAYDYRTRRVWRGEPQGATGSQRTSTAITFIGGLGAAEYEGGATCQPAAPAGEPLVAYTRGPDMGGGVGGLLYTLRRAGSAGLEPEVRHCYANARGDVVAQADQGGVLTWKASYEAFGKRHDESGQNRDRQRANTKEEDPTGLLNEGFRYRDLETGVWLSRDPAGFVDGPNLYAYVMQNPWTSWDPDGLWEESQKTKDLKAKWEATPVSLTKLGRGLQYAASALNPFDSDSNIRSAGRELPQKIDDAANKLDSAPIPYPLKAMGKFSLGVGGAGANLDPLMAASSLTETAKNVKDKGVVEVVKQTAAGIKNDAMNHPEKLLGGIMVSLAVGKAAAGDKVQVHTNGKEGARVLVGNPDGTQLSLNAYMNNAKIAPGIPGVGFNVLESGKRIWGLELHRFNGKANAGSMVRLHRHAGDTASQISKHRHLFSNETY